ncbi:hypothetical protein EW146_g10425 [Bondarzewia mesenterica]|uniref:Aminoglycoside phosphotransferase domain-containing protein n=1 Tax=Bondarzewia mesenterica TaxID=1095465 RepID=A0A4S4KYK3_9AGAM|nr:hypothetical protein EW146_g10425 [Bondarzewia mesenterica]
MCAKAIPHIAYPPTLCFPTLWHPNINHSNLLIAPTGPAEIGGLVDWQSSIIAPYCMQAGFPEAFIYTGGLIDIPEGQVTPKLPSHVSTLSPEEQEVYRVHLKLAMRQKAYQQKIVEENLGRSIIFLLPFGAQLGSLPVQVIRSWSDGVVPLRQSLVDLRKEWESVVSENVQCPISFTDEELRAHEQEVQQCLKYEGSIMSLTEDLGCENDGWVADEEYSRAAKMLKERKENWDDEANGGPLGPAKLA